MNTLYQQHIATLMQRYENAMVHFKLEAIVIASGHKTYYFQDDHSHPFHGYSGAQQWLPFDIGADTFLIIQPGQKPTLVWPIRDDFWHAPNPIPEGEWQNNWHIEPARRDDKWFQNLPKQSAWLGPKSDLEKRDITSCDGLNAYVDFAKAVKTPFEIQALQQASQSAVHGHLAAKQAFLEGKSELDIHLAFLSASQQTSAQEPYPGIVGLNEHAAVLHYEHKAINALPNSRTLLIDAGANCHGYASDITRTYTRHQDDFSALITGLDTLEQSLCQQATTGVAFRDLHQSCLVDVAQLLKDHKICSLGIEEQLEKRIPQVFFPHGLGHLLGLQVHDVGGHQIDSSGQLSMPDDHAPFLRLTRTLEEDMIITIEPGLYFIPMLIEKMQAEVAHHGCDLERIQHFMPFGGIRIEDNLQIKSESSINLTRQAFQALE
ncbi:Xaa-Pro dipeptidase [Marinomonas posidonica]|uniref:Xaa-Pro dipeptidase n=1 Tax=Marinomonas posidonica (strain CECT 7376 / NCIMB 14433 / IVIA-Po-181) TaxID=491952 RepID=F6CYE1_MARPP|nr:Xaa-Pro dipeptidase [Marinomonas posidonica]AEF53468.1 Xaa-Pro dipeptidase [Marinomonas posidonica IVIA-Po-181]